MKIGVLLLLGASLASAASTTQPATTRALRFPPAHTVALHALAMAGGDADGVRRLYDARTPSEMEIVNAYAGMASAVGRLQQVARDKFGEHGFELIGFGRMFNQEVERLKDAKTIERAEEALFFASGPDKPPIVLVFVDGDWKISVARTYPRNSERRIARIRAQAGAYNDLAAEIKAGRYTDAAEARIAGTKKVEKAMSEVEKELARRAATQTSDSPQH